MVVVQGSRGGVVTGSKTGSWLLAGHATEAQDCRYDQRKMARPWASAVDASDGGGAASNPAPTLRVSGSLPQDRNQKALPRRIFGVPRITITSLYILGCSRRIEETQSARSSLVSSQSGEPSRSRAQDGEDEDEWSGDFGRCNPGLPSFAAVDAVTSFAASRT